MKKLTAVFVAILICTNSLSFCQEVPQTIDKPKATATLIVYFETLVAKNVLGADSLKNLVHQDCLINPISEDEANSSNEIFMHHKQINQIIEKNRDAFDLVHVKKWAHEKLQELERHHNLRQNIYEKTRDVHRKAEFVEIPAGKYVSAVDQAEFEIQPGTEIQDTPLTQYQWAVVMHENPSQNNDGPDSEEIVVGDKKIKVRADHPVEHVSLEQIFTYIEKLNEQDAEYVYALSSVQEYEALLQSILGPTWIMHIGQQNMCSGQTCAVGSENNFFELGHKRIWYVIGAVWQFTRDQAVITPEFIADIVFGGSYNTQKSSLTNISSILRPVLCRDSADQGIGFRLTRRKKDKALGWQFSAYTMLASNWNQSIVHEDDHWRWEKPCNVLIHQDDGVRFIMENSEHYSCEFQYTIEKLRDMVINDDVTSLKTSPSLVLNEIVDITPLVYFAHLENLALSYCVINDMLLFSNLTNLRNLIISDSIITGDIGPFDLSFKLSELVLRGNIIKGVIRLNQVGPRVILLDNWVRS